MPRQSPLQREGKEQHLLDAAYKLFLGKGCLLYTSACLYHNDQKLELTRNEFRILQLLFQNLGHTVCREDMMQALWQSDCFIDDNTLTVNMTRLRKRLDSIGLCGLIRTQKGMGYIVEETL